MKTIAHLVRGMDLMLEVFIRQDPSTGDLILSRKPNNWTDFFLALKNADVPADFLTPQDRNQGSQNRDPFDGVPE